MVENVPYHLWEAMLYDILRTLPHIVLVLYAFRGHWRFGKKTALLLAFLVWVIEMLLSEIDIFVPNVNIMLLNILEVIVYIVFIFVELKEHIGKLVFTVLALSNLGNIMVVGGKCLEGLLFPKQALLRYHFTYALCCLPVLAAELTLAYLLIFRDICNHNGFNDAPEEQEKISGYLWRYLWLVPAVFSLIGYQNIYGSGQPSLTFIIRGGDMTTNIFQDIKDRVDLRDLVRYYGLDVNRGGFACCPFHNERNPSFKVYEDHYHCFGCGEHGDHVDFVQKLYGISNIEAAKKISHDFGLGLDNGELAIPVKPKRPKPRKDEGYELWLNEAISANALLYVFIEW